MRLHEKIDFENSIKSWERNEARVRTTGLLKRPRQVRDCFPQSPLDTFVCRTGPGVDTVDDKMMAFVFN